MPLFTTRLKTLILNCWVGLRNGNSLDSYSSCGQFTFQPQHWLYFVCLFVCLFLFSFFLLSISRQMPWWYIDQTMATSKSYPFCHLPIFQPWILYSMSYLQCHIVNRQTINKILTSLLLHRASCRLNNYHKTNKCTNCM